MRRGMLVWVLTLCIASQGDLMAQDPPVQYQPPGGGTTTIVSGTTTITGGTDTYACRDASGVLTCNNGNVSLGGVVSVGTSIELGHASDTTLTRSAAGVVAVEGGPIKTPAGAGTGSVTTGGVICKGAPAQATTGTSEEVLATCTIPANTLDADGESVRVQFFAQVEANANSKTIQLRIGGILGSLIGQIGPIGANNQNFFGHVTLLRTGAATGVAYQKGGRLADDSTGDGASDFANRDPTVDWTASQDLVITGTTPTASGDLTLATYTVEVVQ